MKRIVTLSLLVFYASIYSFSQAQSKDTLRVLFIGNSYTIGHGNYENPELAVLISELAKSSGEVFEYGSSLKGGKDFKWHYEQKKALQKISENKWDYVVLQNHSMGTIDSVESFKKYGALFNEAIRESGAKTMFYMTWGRENKPQMIDTIAYEYLTLADSLNASIVPCGLAWKTINESNYFLNMYYSDKSHPRLPGVYFNACVFYCALYNKNPENLFSQTKYEEIGIHPTTAHILEKIAWETWSNLDSLKNVYLEKKIVR